jgi:D-beta-D-heptose 7-phosphate kinase/D-beta-D-heptose 1-phosphate adenosyltransferase
MGNREILANFKHRAVLVLGDLMTDEYIWGRVSRISPEAPVPVVEVTHESVRVGGAANVAANLRALGAEVHVVGVVGNDPPGERLINDLEGLGIKGDGVVVDRGRPTTIKTRVVAGSQHVVRFDREDGGDLRAGVNRRLIQGVRERLPRVHALLISDYAKGVVSPGLVRQVLPLARLLGKIVTVDPKVRHFGLFKRATAVAPNHHEAGAAAGTVIRSEDDLLRVGVRLVKRLEIEALLVTRGEQGMSLFERGGGVHHIPAVAKEVYDVTGAGDTVMSALTLALAAGATMRQAAAIANHAAGVVVGKVGTAVVTLGELQAALRGDRRS